MQKKLRDRIEAMRDDIINSTRKLVQIKSVETEGKPDMPFGQGVNEALETALTLGDILEMKTKNVDGYAGHVEIGSGEELLGILCHLDVVPAGSSWTYPPFGAEIHNNRIYGRGAVDDKGPAVAAMYAMKAVRDLDINLDKRVRLILGTDEESGWEGISYYLEQEQVPDFAVTPDASYPVIHAEKGIIVARLKMEYPSPARGIIKSISGGNAPNMVPDYCRAVLTADNIELLEEDVQHYMLDQDLNIELTRNKDNDLVIKSIGKSAHGSRPELGKNAISQLMVFLARLPLADTGIKDFIDFYGKKIGQEYYGSSIGCDMEDEVSGKLIFNVGMINVDRKKAEIVINIRYPVTQDKEEVMSALKKGTGDKGFIIEENQHIAPLYIPGHDRDIKNLLEVYAEITGEVAEPLAIGGGTYARAVEKGAAFGPVFPGQTKMAHQKNEYIDIDDLIKNAWIYAAMLVKLCSSREL